MPGILTADRKIRFNAAHSEVQVNFDEKQQQKNTNHSMRKYKCHETIFSFNGMLEKR